MSATIRRSFPRGARPSPRHKLLAARPFRPLKAAPAQFAYVPPQLSFWGNENDGDCVTAEECFAKAATTSPEVFVPEATAVAWAQAHGYLNGADLTDVMQTMQQNGFVVGSDTYDDGPYSGVDYSTESVLQAAIAVGPVKIGIDADALPSTAGQQQGWYATGGTPGQFSNEDHCVSVCGYGPAGWLFQQLGVALPAALSATQAGYLVFTWSSIGFVDHAWIMSTCAEAWLRNPTTVAVGPTPTPTPTPAPTPCQKLIAALTEEIAQAGPFLRAILERLLASVEQHCGAADAASHLLVPDLLIRADRWPWPRPGPRPIPVPGAGVRLVDAMTFAESGIRQAAGAAAIVGVESAVAGAKTGLSQLGGWGL